MTPARKYGSEESAGNVKKVFSNIMECSTWFVQIAVIPQVVVSPDK